MVREVALGFDIGTTSVKAGLLWLDADVPMEVASLPYATSRPRPGWAEQDPETWITTMAACWAALHARCGPVRVRSVGICSQVNTHVLVDEQLVALYPAITWQDIRAAPEAAAMDARVEGRRTGLWGGPFTVDASFSLSRLAWLAAHEPATRRAGRWLLSPKDYCVAALTGEVATDTISPIGLVGPDGGYIGAVLELVPGAGALLPPLHGFDKPAGLVQDGNRVGLPPGMPVAVGTMDAWGSVYGSGLVRPGQAMEVAGTSEIIGVLSDRSVPTRGVISFAPVGGRYLHAGPTQAGGDALDWATRCFSTSAQALLAMAEEARREPQALVFLPHLAGERAPLWNPDARGLFLGLTTSTELRHMALAVLEGVAFSARHLLAECAAAADVPIEELRLSGGGARSAVWNQLKASVHGRPMLTMATLDTGTLGAALMGLVAAGIEADIAEAAERWVRVAAQVDPQPGTRARLDTLYGVYREAYDALVPIFPRLAAVADQEVDTA
jgi:xylulokinase